MSGLNGFLGRFHPLLVHFPIAFVVLAGLVEAIVARRGDRSPWAAASLVPLTALAAFAAAVAATAGYLLGLSGGYRGPTYERHLQLGISVALLATVTALAAWQRQRVAGGAWTPVVRGLLLVTLAILAGAGHLGATLTHGEGYLTELAPAPIRGLVERITDGPAVARYSGPAERAPVFRTLIRPVLQRQCASCHATGWAQGGLALDTPESILKGGDHGPVVTPGRALGSELVRRVWLPAEHPDAMPPRGQRPLSAADAGLLRWWVESGASFEQPLADVEIAPEILPVIEARLGPVSRGGPTLPQVTLPPLDPARLEAVRARAVDVRPIADGSPFLQVRLTGRDAAGDDARVASLSPLAPHVVWLTLADSGITDAAFPAIARMANLTRLDVSRTAATDSGVRALGSLGQLEALNLYGTGVTDAGITALAVLPRLRRVYLWQTAVTPDGVARLKTAAPRLEVVVGDDAEGEGAPAEGSRAGGERPDTPRPDTPR